LLLKEAVETFQQALQVYTSEHLPEKWAATQTDLATAFTDQGIRTTGEAGAKLLAQAVEACHQEFAV
jgi:hypothetical protein